MDEAIEEAYIEGTRQDEGASQQTSFREELRLVFLKLKHRQHFVMNKISPKLSARYYDPFKILEKIGEVAYRLKLPPSWTHPVLVGDYKADELPTRIEDENVEVIEHVLVLASSIMERGNELANVWFIRKGRQQRITYSAGPALTT